MATLYEMKQELEQLIRQRENTVGIDFKRLNFKIAELQSKILHAERVEQ